MKGFAPKPAEGCLSASQGWGPPVLVEPHNSMKGSCPILLWTTRGSWSLPASLVADSSCSSGLVFSRLPLMSLTNPQDVRLQEPPSIAGSRVRLCPIMSWVGVPPDYCWRLWESTALCWLTGYWSSVSWAWPICLPAPLLDQRPLDLPYRTKPPGAATPSLTQPHEWFKEWSCSWLSSRAAFGFQATQPSLHLPRLPFWDCHVYR